MMAVTCVSAFANEVVIGAKIENLSFKDIRYLPRTLNDFGQPKAYVLAFISNTCPLAQRYMPHLIALDKEFGPQGVQVVAVNAGGADTIMDMAKHMLDFGAEFPVVKDVKGDCAKALGITRTPQIAILNADRALVYRGRVDDQYRLGGVKPEVGRHDLREALLEVVAGKPVSVAETQAEGCLITYPEMPQPATPITYTRDIAPILNQNCVPCHREKGNAPFSLTDYRKAANYADMVAEVIAEERMPPWYAHPGHGKFANEARLTAAERLLVQQWLAGGTPEGDAKDLPEPPEFQDTDWAFEPDLVIEGRQNNVIAASGFVPYVYTLMPHVFENDTWLDGIEIKGTNPKVVHHANLFYTPHGLDFVRSENFLTGTVPGGGPARIPEGQGLFIPKGATLGLQIHYVTTGKIEADKPRVALRFAKNPVKKRIYYKIMDNSKFLIPPAARAHRVTSGATLEADATITALFSHMHLRGRDMEFFAYPPNGEKITLLSLPNYNFDWQLAYYINQGDMVLPAGTKLECIAHFDNSPFNPYNPDPNKEIREGPQTVDEMMQGFMFYTRNDETLDIKVDPKTGWEIKEVASN